MDAYHKNLLFEEEKILKFDKSYENHSVSEKKSALVWEFENKKDALNFIKLFQTKVMRFLLSFSKFNANLNHGRPCKAIPWLDFTQEWNDAKLCKEFEISDELWNYIDNFIPNYYDDYKSGFEKEEEDNK